MTRVEVRNLKKELDIHSLMTKRFKRPDMHVNYNQRSNLIKSLNEFHSIWRIDITHIKLKSSQWVYLSTILENHISKVLAYKISSNMTNDLITEIMLITLNHYQKLEYLHFDMGSQSFEKLLQIHQIKHSHSLKKQLYDNNPIEAFHFIKKGTCIIKSIHKL